MLPFCQNKTTYQSANTAWGNTKACYKKYEADTPFDYTFMDDAFNARYKAEDRLASIFSIFTVITIVLAGNGAIRIGSIYYRTAH